MQELVPGTRYGSFQIVAQVGQGMTGPVYHGIYKDGTHVGLKFSDARDESVRAYFLNEVTLVRQAEQRDHPYLTRYVTSNTSQEPFYLATRYISGNELSEAMRGSCSPGFALQVADQLASALDYLHFSHPNAPVIHRDVKPANVLLSGNGDAVLIDLSAACYQGFSLANERGLGTPQYMPPEQYTGAECPQSDQFALGMLIYQMLAGRSALPRRPAAAKRRLELLRRTDHRRMRRALRHLPSSAAVLARATAYDWQARFQSCEEFAYALGRALASDGVPLGTNTPPSPPPPRPWGYLAMALVTLAALALLINSFQVPATTPALLPQPAAASVASLGGMLAGGTGIPTAATTTAMPSRPNQSAPEAIIYATARGCALRDSPSYAGGRQNYSATESFVPSDVPMALLGRTDSWYNVRLPDQRTGWCAPEQVLH